MPTKLTTEPTWDVIIAGAGPAGSTAANLLAAQGHAVLVIEKEVFPRFHVGESLLPCDLPIFERLGFAPTRTEYVHKAGAFFHDEAKGQCAEYRFVDGLPDTPTYAWQVDRATFDHALMDLAESRGAEVRYGARVNAVELDDDGVTVRYDNQTLRARFFIDATGQDAFLGRRVRAIEPIKGFGIVASFTRIDEVSADVHAELLETGNVHILFFEDGWGWIIPLTDRRASMGVVTQRSGLGPEHLKTVIAASPLMSRVARGAKMQPPGLTRNFAYVNRAAHSPRVACIGDASAFLDPVFSSGLSLAMIGAEKVADALGPALREGTEASIDPFAKIQAEMKGAYDVFGTLIKSFYEHTIFRKVVFDRDPDLQLRAGLISILAGDVFRSDNAFQNMLMASRRRFRIDKSPPKGGSATANPAHSS